MEVAVVATAIAIVCAAGSSPIAGCGAATPPPAHPESASDGGGLPSESVSINFSKIKFDYKQQNADGSLAAGSPKTWDVKLNKASG